MGVADAAPVVCGHLKVTVSATSSSARWPAYFEAWPCALFSVEREGASPPSYLGRVIRDIERRIVGNEGGLL